MIYVAWRIVLSCLNSPAKHLGNRAQFASYPQEISDSGTVDGCEIVELKTVLHPITIDFRCSKLLPKKSYLGLIIPMDFHSIPICEPWCWNIYQHLPQKSPSHADKYSSTMVRICSHLGFPLFHPILNWVKKTGFLPLIISKRCRSGCGPWEAERSCCGCHVRDLPVFGLLH